MGTQRVLVKANFVKISKAGIDVNSASEKDLLVSLTSRNNQVISTGLKTADSTSGNTATYNITFPAQQSIPDFYLEISDGSTIVYDFSNNMPSFECTASTSGVSVVTTGAPSGSKLAFVIFRKRIGE